MNIFLLSPSPVLSAKWQHDKHVVKMPLESMQLLYHAAHKLYGVRQARAPGLGTTHAKHPCAIWAAARPEHYNWLVQHTEALFDEYMARFVRIHRSSVYLPAYAQLAERSLALPEIWPICMPAKYIAPGGTYDIVKALQSYDAYYRAEKLYPNCYRWAAQMPAAFKDNMFEIEKYQRILAARSIRSKVSES